MHADFILVSIKFDLLYKIVLHKGLLLSNSKGFQVQKQFKRSSRIESIVGQISNFNVRVESTLKFIETSKCLAGPDRIHSTLVWMAAGPPFPLTTCPVTRSHHESD